MSSNNRAVNQKLKNDYQQGHRRMGIYQIRNLTNDKALIGASTDLPGILNRHQFQLKMGSHPNRTLQAEWQEAGPENFAFEILDELTPNHSSDDDYRADLLFLEDLWLEKLLPYGERGYNERKKSKEERLRMIAQNRREKDSGADSNT